MFAYGVQDALCGVSLTWASPARRSCPRGSARLCAVLVLRARSTRRFSTFCSLVSACARACVCVCEGGGMLRAGTVSPYRTTTLQSLYHTTRVYPAWERGWGRELERVVRRARIFVLLRNHNVDCEVKMARLVLLLSNHVCVRPRPRPRPRPRRRRLCVGGRGVRDRRAPVGSSSPSASARQKRRRTSRAGSCLWTPRTLARRSCSTFGALTCESASRAAASS